MAIKLSYKQSVAWKYLEDKETNELLYGGGAGGGKSFFGCVWHIYRRTTYPKTRGVIGRSKISILEQSTLVTYFKVASAMGYLQGKHFFYNSQKHVINWYNGSQTILKDMFLYPSDPDFTSFGSTEYTDGFVDEATEVTIKAIEILASRIRWMLHDYSLVPKLLLTCNPAPGGIKERFISVNGMPVELKPHQKFVQSLITENPDLIFKEMYAEQLERMSSEYDKQRLLFGNWDASADVSNPFATQWMPIKHLSSEAIFQPNRQLIISVDFNLNPFCVTFYQLYLGEKGYTCYVVDEMEIKNGSIPLMIDRIKELYINSLPNALLTGDALGKNGQLSERDNASLYLQLLRGLGMRESQLRVNNNPTHENSRADLNYVLYHFPIFKVNPKCKGVINDMQNVQCDAFGSIIKKNRKDLNQRADFLDTVRYFVHNMLQEWMHRHQKSNSIFNTMPKR